MEHVVRAKNQRSKRFLEDRAPKLTENTKKAVFIRGPNCNALVTDFMRDMHSLKKPHAVMYKRKNAIKPFEDESNIEFFSSKTDCSLFLFGSHNKKRPNNAIIGRMFDYQILDMLEFGITNYTSIKMFKTIKSTIGAKPCLVFAGDAFETEVDYIRLKNLLIDFFRGEELSSIDLAGIEPVISVTAHEGTVHLRVYRVLLKKSGGRTPRVELMETGPGVDLCLRRSRIAKPDRFKEACRKPRAVMPRKVKNKKTDSFGSKLGQVHMTRQDYTQLNTRRMKGLKRKWDEDNNDTNKTNKLDN